jgi:hypothetical protein
MSLTPAPVTLNIRIVADKRRRLLDTRAVLCCSTPAAGLSQDKYKLCPLAGRKWSTYLVSAAARARTSDVVTPAAQRVKISLGQPAFDAACSIRGQVFFPPPLPLRASIVTDGAWTPRIMPSTLRRPLRSHSPTVRISFDSCMMIALHACCHYATLLKVLPWFSVCHGPMPRVSYHHELNSNVSGGDGTGSYTVKTHEAGAAHDKWQVRVSR